MKESSDLVDVVFDLNMSILLVEMLQGCAQTASRLLAVFGFVRPREQIDINNELPCSSSRQLLELQQKVLMETCKKTTTTTTLMAADASAAAVAAVVDDDNLAAACCRVVLGRLGMGASMSVGSDHQGAERSRRMEGGGGGGGVREIIMELLEEKEASMEELKEAFYVFDRNEDGYVTAEELWGVMRRLGLNEGLRLEDCRRMIGVYDQDGDGRISFHEFTLGINTVS